MQFKLCITDILKTFTENDNSVEVWKIEIPRIPHLFTGTGDLFAALLLAWMHRTDGVLCVAMEKCTNTLQEVLLRTASFAETMIKEGKVNEIKLLELRLIQSKEAIENPPHSLKAVRLL